VCATPHQYLVENVLKLVDVDANADVNANADAKDI
jgi:hypothetical protein